MTAGALRRVFNSKLAELHPRQARKGVAAGTLSKWGCGQSRGCSYRICAARSVRAPRVRIYLGIGKSKGDFRSVRRHRRRHGRWPWKRVFRWCSPPGSCWLELLALTAVAELTAAKIGSSVLLVLLYSLQLEWFQTNPVQCSTERVRRPLTDQSRVSLAAGVNLDHAGCRYSRSTWVLTLSTLGRLSIHP